MKFDNPKGAEVLSKVKICQLLFELDVNDIQGGSAGEN